MKWLLLFLLWSKYLYTETCENGGVQLLILKLKDVDAGYFSNDIRNTGNENPSNENANTYSIIGTLDPQDFIDANGEYEFYLEYLNALSYPDAALRWAQTSWLTDSFGTGGCCDYAPGFREIAFIPTQRTDIADNDMFYGLGRGDTIDGITCYLDGTSLDEDYFNCVGALPDGAWEGGIPGYNRGVHHGEALYVCKPATSHPTKAPTDIPTMKPSVAPTTTSPANDPSAHPTLNPTDLPILNPAPSPTNYPPVDPTNDPTLVPIIAPLSETTERMYTKQKTGYSSTESKLNERRAEPVDVIFIALLILVIVLCLTIAAVGILFLRTRKNIMEVMKAPGASGAVHKSTDPSRISQSGALVTNNAEFQHAVRKVTEDGLYHNEKEGPVGGRDDVHNDEDLLLEVNTLDEGEGGRGPVPNVHNVSNVNLASEDPVILGDDETIGRTVK